MWLVPISAVCDGYRSNNLTIGFTNGCFDILHAGHLHLLREVRKHCDILILGLNNDISISKLKPGRPINDWSKRTKALTNTNLVDFIVEFESEGELEKLIQSIKPDVMFKGYDYKDKEITGSRYVNKTILVPLIEGISTTAIVNQFV